MIAILVLIPERMGVPSYVYPMGLMSAVAFSWGCMLVWADREPIPRRWVLLPTILVGLMLLLAVIFSVYVGAIALRSVFLNILLLPAMVALWSFSYYNSRDIET
jgi:4-amino-4-deoxy-L-arabinose transferase-like glycosyltransferase